MKNRIFRFVLIVLPTLAVLGLLYLSLFSSPLEKAPGQYSAILYQYTDSDWTSLLEGIKQAEEDAGVVVNYVTLPSDGTAENELELMEREIDNGANGLLLAPVDSDALAAEVEALTGTMPVLTLETGLGDEEADISGDNYEMGFLLGLQVAESMKLTGETSVCIIREYTCRQSVRQRLAGFADAIRQELPEAAIEEYSRSEGDFSLPVCIATMYRQHEPGMYLAALDKYCTEALIDASESSELSREEQALFCSRAYGIGSTEKTVSGLDSGKIYGLVYQNEFSMGYQGLLALIQQQQSGKAEPIAEITYYYVTRETLYEPEHQRLLFPLG